MSAEPSPASPPPGARNTATRSSEECAETTIEASVGSPVVMASVSPDQRTKRRPAAGVASSATVPYCFAVRDAEAPAAPPPAETVPPGSPSTSPAVAETVTHRSPSASNEYPPPSVKSAGSAPLKRMASIAAFTFTSASGSARL